MNPFTSKDARHAAPGYSVIDARLVVHGDIETDGTVRVDGRVEGTTHRADTIIVGPGGAVWGNIEARDIAVAGTIHGNVRATGRLEIEPGAAIEGEVHAATMVLHEGGAVNGQVSIGSADAASAIAAGRRLALTKPEPVTGGRAR